MQYIIDSRTRDGRLVDTIAHAETEIARDAILADCEAERADDRAEDGTVSIVGILYCERADVRRAIDNATRLIADDYDRWSAGKDFSPDERDNIYRCIEALADEGLHDADDPAPFPHLSLSELADRLHDRHSEGDWESAEPIARWIIHRLYPSEIVSPIGRD
jgi:hypothetical protein